MSKKYESGSTSSQLFFGLTPLAEESISKEINMMDTPEEAMYDRTTNETGRSMVEIIGVLAIIGVLTVGGITGYSYGMDKYKANQTINDIMLRVVDLMTQKIT